MYTFYFFSFMPHSQYVAEKIKEGAFRNTEDVEARRILIQESLTRSSHALRSHKEETKEIKWKQRLNISSTVTLFHLRKTFKRDFLLFRILLLQGPIKHLLFMLIMCTSKWNYRQFQVFKKIVNG